jgi:hypothetical protein
MFRLLVVLCCVLSLNAQLAPEVHPAPEPYSFAFSSPNDDGTSSSREETGDANGRVTGSYTILGADGQQRRVEYVADENGFRANVITNEIGTESQNAADTQFQSSAPTAAQLTAQWEASGAGKARLAGQFVGGAGQILATPAVVRAPLNEFRQGEGLVAAPIAPIGGGFAGVQSLRFNQGIAKPIAKAAQIALPVAPVALPAPVAQPLPAPIGIRTGGAVTKFGLRTQAIAPFNTGFVGFTPVGVNNLGFGQLGVGVAPLGASAGHFQQFDSFKNVQTPFPARGLALGGFPVNNGANLFALPVNGAYSQSQLLSGESVETITQKKESDGEDYGNKSK